MVRRASHEATVYTPLLADERGNGNGTRTTGESPPYASPRGSRPGGLRWAKAVFCHATEMLLVLAPLTCPQELLQTSPQKLLAEESRSCSEATGDNTLDAIRRST
jgi:hypothetical protein